MTRRYRSIDIIKGVAMIMVILVHYGQNYTLGISKAFQYLQMGCPVFFVASGFGIMCLVNKKYDGALNSKNVKPFYLSRLKALAPGWYVTFIIIFLVNTVLLMVTGKTLSFGSNREPLSIICNLLFVNGLLPFCNNNVMPGGWYIGTTVILYALTPLILKGIKETHNRRLFFIFSSIIGMVIWTILYFIFKDAFYGDGFGYFFFLIHYPEYLLGIMLYYDFSENLLNDAQASRCLPFGCISLVIAIVLFYAKLPFGSIPSAWMTALSTYFFLYFMLSHEQKHENFKACRFLEKCGKNSYYIFLLHAFFAWPFVRVALKVLARIGISTELSFVLLIPCSVFLAYWAGEVLRLIVTNITSVIFAKKQTKQA